VISLEVLEVIIDDINPQDTSIEARALIVHLKQDWLWDPLSVPDTLFIQWK
jgi:hypothetical protein